jgi:hypothetical protein
MNEAEWLNAVNATDLWAFVRHEMGFNRRIVDSPDAEYNKRLLYLAGVAVCRRFEHLFPEVGCHRMLQVAEAFAEGRATLNELCDAHEDVDRMRDDLLPAANGAAVEAVFWLCPDDYKVRRALAFLSDAAGYLRAVAEGILSAEATLHDARAVWKHPAFLAGKGEEERALCGLIRHVIGNPFRPSRPLPPAIFAWNDGAVRKLAQTIYDDRAFERLPLLADALEEAGCKDADTLGHCRAAGEHFRGCWAVDLLLGKQ